MVQVGTRAAGVVIPFTATHPRRARTAAAEGSAARGEILLFTGVRYERMPEPSPDPSPVLAGRPASGRRRRRS